MNSGEPQQQPKPAAERVAGAAESNSEMKNSARDRSQEGNVHQVTTGQNHRRPSDPSPPIKSNQSSSKHHQPTSAPYSVNSNINWVAPEPLVQRLGCHERQTWERLDAQYNQMRSVTLFGVVPNIWTVTPQEAEQLSLRSASLAPIGPPPGYGSNNTCHVQPPIRPQVPRPETRLSEPASMLPFTNYIRSQSSEPLPHLSPQSEYNLFSSGINWKIDLTAQFQMQQEAQTDQSTDNDEPLSSYSHGLNFGWGSPTSKVNVNKNAQTPAEAPAERVKEQVPPAKPFDSPGGSSLDSVAAFVERIEMDTKDLAPMRGKSSDRVAAETCTRHSQQARPAQSHNIAPIDLMSSSGKNETWSAKVRNSKPSVGTALAQSKNSGLADKDATVRSREADIMTTQQVKPLGVSQAFNRPETNKKDKMVKSELNIKEIETISVTGRKPTIMLPPALPPFFGDANNDDSNIVVGRTERSEYADQQISDRLLKLKTFANDGFGVVPITNSFTIRNSQTRVIEKKPIIRAPSQKQFVITPPVSPDSESEDDSVENDLTNPGRKRSAKNMEPPSPSLPSDRELRNNKLVLYQIGFASGRQGLFQGLDKTSQGTPLEELINEWVVVNQDDGCDIGILRGFEPLDQLVARIPEVPFMRVLRRPRPTEMEILKNKAREEAHMVSVANSLLKHRPSLHSMKILYCEFQVDKNKLVVYADLTQYTQFNDFVKNLHAACETDLCYQSRIFIQRRFVGHKSKGGT